MFLFLFCFASSRFSFGVALQAMHARVGYIRAIKFKQPIIKMLKFPKAKQKSQEFFIGALPGYSSHDATFNLYVENIAKNFFLFEGDLSFDDFKRNTLQILFDLSNDIEYRNSKDRIFAFERLRSLPFLDVSNSNKLQKLKQALPTANGTSSVLAPEGRSIRTLIADASVFEGQTVKVVIGEVEWNSNGLPGKVHVSRSVDNLNLSLDYLVRAGIVSERSGGKPIELLVVGTSGITEDDIRNKIDQIIGDGEDYRRQVGASLPNEKHSALMGGVGLSAGYHYHTKNFIFNVRTGVDHIWGRFKQTGPQGMDTENVPRLGWGITLGTGIDYKFTEKSTIGLEGGVRFSEFKIPQMDKPTTTKSSWFVAPYAQIVCGFYPHPDYNISVFTGYFFPRTFEVKTEGTRITQDTKCKVDGIFGGLRFARYF